MRPRQPLSLDPSFDAITVIHLTRPLASYLRRNQKVVAIIVSILILSSLGAYYWLRESDGIATSSVHVIAIDKVAINRVDAPTGSVIYVILTYELNSGKETWNVNSTSFEVVSNRSSTYAEVSASLPGTNSPIAIPVGQHRMIELLFQLPINQSPVQLIYNDQTIRTKTAIAVPSASGWVSKFNDISDVTKTGNGNYVIGIVAYALVLNTSYPSFKGERVSYAFFTGDRVTVGIVLEYYKQPADPASIMVSSVTNTDGFSVVSMKPSLPVTMTGWGSRAEIQVTVLAPNESYSGGVHFVVGFNSSTP